jgi:hypothetical protein
MKKIAIVAFIIVLALILVKIIFVFDKKVPNIITNFEECIAQSNIILESYPRQCRTKEGKTFTEDIGNMLDKMKLIILDSPRPNDKIPNPVTLTGKARGSWFFEASFPAVILDSNGKVLGTIPVQADGEWMTSDFVPFSVTFPYIKPTTTKGTLILKKDNPSGESKNDDELRVPVIF